MSPNCYWRISDEDAGEWEAQCGALWMMIEGTPTENEMSFCPNCGRPLVTVAITTQDE